MLQLVALRDTDLSPVPLVPCPAVFKLAYSELRDNLPDFITILRYQIAHVDNQ